MSINLYKELKSKQGQEVNNFPMFFAFSTEQFAEGMKKLDLEPTDTDKICSTYGGGYIKKVDSDSLHKMFDNHSKEMKENIENDLTGEGFIYDMFYYELCNHEYGYTYEIDATLDSLDLTIGDINNNEILRKALKKACEDIKIEDI
jgi:hypothetical protein